MPFLPRITSILWFSFFISWEQRKLGEVARSFEYGLNAAAKEYDGLNKYLRITDIDDVSRKFDTDNLTSPDTDLVTAENYRLVDGDILFARTGASVGKSYIYRASDGLVYFAGFLIRAKIKPEYDAEFVFQNTLSESYQTYILITSQRSGQPGVNAQEYSDYTFYLPTYDEQQKIGAFLCNLDNLITLHQRKQNGRFVLILGENSSLILPIDWEQRKLGSIVYRASEMSETDDLPRVEYEDIDAGQGSLNKDLKEKVSTKKGIMFQSGDVLYGKLRPYLKNWLFAWFSGVAVGDFWVLRSNQVSQSFIYRLVQTPAFEYIANQSTGSKMPRADWNLVSNTTFAFPTSNEEQEAIGQIFLKLDNLITLHQCKEKSRIAHADKKVMFHTSLKLANDWEQRKVGELLEERDVKAPKSREYPLMAFIANEGVAPKGDRYDRSALVNDTENKPYKQTELGDFIYSSNNLETGSIGLNKYGKASISPVYSIFYPTGLADSDFLGRRLVRKDFINEMVKWRQGVIYGQWRIHESDFIKIEVAVPCVEEQRKIGRLLDSIDNLITLHQRKQQEYELRKSSSILSTDKRINPLTWEQRKLGDIGKTYGGLSGKAKEDFGHGDARFVTYMNVFSNPVGNPAVTEAIELDSRQNEIKKGDIFFTTSSETPDEVGMSSVWMENMPNTYLNSFCFGYRPTLKFDLYYLAYVLRSDSIRNKFIFLAQGISRYNISKNRVMEMSIPIPSMDEQVFLGKLFKNLDNLITLHQRGEIIYKRRQT